MISKQGQQYYWIKISNGQRKIQNGRIEDLNRGSAVTRSLDQLIKFDEDVRNELCGSSTAVVTGDGILLPPFPVQPDVGLIQEYLEAIFRIQRAVHSASVVSLLQKNTDTTAQDVFQPLMYIQYLLPGMQDDPSFLTLSRIGGLLKKTVPNVCNGWWVIWWFRLEHVSLTSALSSRLNKYPQVEFKLFVSNSCAESFEDEPSSGQELVTHQLCDISEDHSAFHGSYRLPSESVGLFSASLEFRNMGILPSVLGTTRVAVECSCVPHDIFKAACEAAQDQNKSERRRRQAPMLATILDGDESLVVDVKPWSLQTEPEEEQNMKKKSLPESENRARLVDDPSFIATLQRERDTLQCALEKANENLKEANKKLRMVESERRVWQMSKEEIFRQISLLIENAAKDKEEKKNLAGSLKEAENEIGELRRQLNFQETKVSNRGRSIEHGEVVRGVQAEITDMALVLEELTSELQEKNRAIEGLHRSLEQAETGARDERKRYDAAADEALMREKILQGEVRHLQRELQDTKGQPKTHKSEHGHPQVRTRRHLNTSISTFQHPDSRLNEQLVTLRDRHEKLTKLLVQDPNNLQNLEILGRIEKVIQDIVASAKAVK